MTAPADQAGPTSESGRPKRKGLHFWFAFAGVSIVAFTSALDTTIFAIALPVVAEDLHATTLQSFWAGISFLLTSVALLPIHTVLSDVFGRKPVLYVCITCFALGSLVVGLSRTGNMLIAGRAVQGLGGGGLEALAEIILTDMTTLKERPLFLGLLSLMFSGGAILGPIVGALFAQYVTWRWISVPNSVLLS